MSTTPPPSLRIHPADNVVIARRQLLGGTALMATIAFSAQRYFELSAEAAGG